MLINGQSGDFITGDHIPKEYTGDYSINELFKIIFQKHYSLWSKMKNKNLDLMSQQFNKEIDKVNFPDYEKKKYAFFSRHEYWEWVERQTKWVVNGQRVYDFFNLKWYLPLWEKTFIDYWQRMPYEYKVNQNLYREYLKKYNYKGIFDIPKAIPNPWTGMRKLLPIIVSILFSFNRKLKSDIYKKLYYHSTHKYLYEYFGKEDFLTNYRNSRSPQSFIVKALVNKILNKETLRRKNVIDF